MGDRSHVHGKTTSDFAMLIKLCSIIVFRSERDVKKITLNHADVFIKYIYGVFFTTCTSGEW